MSVQQGVIHIGISGWRYSGWRGAFYPKRLPQRQELQYASGYSSKALRDWAKRILRWSRGEQLRTRHCLAKPCDAEPLDVVVYFDNDAKVHAPFDAIDLAEILRDMGGTVAEPAGLKSDEVLSNFEPPNRSL